MKRYIALALVCLALTDVMAQKQKVVEKIVDEDYYPVDGAVVTLKRTNQQAVTDKNGVFVLEEVPVYFDSLQVTKGKRSGYVDLPMRIQMRTQVMQRFSLIVKAGIGAGKFMQGPESKLKDGLSIYGGVGADIRMSKHWAFQPSLLLVSRKMKGYDFYDYYTENNGDGSSSVSYDQVSGTYNPFYLEIPLLFALKYRIGNDLNLVFSFGPYIDLGISGDIKKEFRKRSYDSSGNYNRVEYVTESQSLFGKRFTGGFAYGIGVEYGHFLIGGTGRVGCTSWNHSEGFLDVAFEIGYRF
ncbi:MULTISPECIES: porin family protein [Bacteroides]|uniref:porin family protein n=1 Tax=Bacteroides TaxID=816 RepID=UPI001D0E65D9|nr:MULTISPECIES: porin family protein [Bacteroides]MCC2235053.1 PorT family protein [Bacteroides hominis (ex Afrizal et al. 2022)]MCY6327960.1 porin family protein [Bacteroides fragilis]MCZ2663406.1 porin family protein [Bacteroides fragilis]